MWNVAYYHVTVVYSRKRNVIPDVMREETGASSSH
jgi:hypothetical protein